MIRYHGGPITPELAAIEAWKATLIGDGHAMVSFANPEQTALAFAKAGSVVFDNGAFPIFTAGEGKIDIPKYICWVNEWKRRSNFDWCLIPDIIDGVEEDNNDLIEKWVLPKHISVPIWHLHESLDKLQFLVSSYQRVAIGSSGKYISIGTDLWWNRIAEAMQICCDEDGFPKTKLHGLRQMDKAVFIRIPYSSVDSSTLSRNVGLDCNWVGSYTPLRKETRARVIRDNVASYPVAERWVSFTETPKIGVLF